MSTYKKPAAFNSGSRTGRRRITPLQKYLKKEANAYVKQQKPFRSRQATGTGTFTNSRNIKTGTKKIFTRTTTKKVTSFKAKPMVTNTIFNRSRKAFYPNK